MKELLSGLIGPVTGIINKVVPDKDESARLAHETFITVERIPVRVEAFLGYTRHDLIFLGGFLERYLAGGTYCRLRAPNSHLDESTPYAPLKFLFTRRCLQSLRAVPNCTNACQPAKHRARG